MIRDTSAYLDFLALAIPVVALPAAASIAFALASRRPAWGAFGVSLLAFCLVATVGPWIPQSSGSPDGGVRILSASSQGAKGEVALGQWRELFSEVDAEIVVLSELNGDFARELWRDFDHVLFTEHVGTDVPSRPLDSAHLGVFSSVPIRMLDEPSTLPAGLPGLRLAVETADANFVLYALHLPKPSPRSSGLRVSYPERSDLVETLRRAISAERQPVVVAGDLNLTDRERPFRRLREELDDAMRDGWAGPTSVKSPLFRALLLRIDHILMQPGWCSEDASRPELPKSDHRGVVATVGPCRT